MDRARIGCEHAEFLATEGQGRRRRPLAVQVAHEVITRADGRRQRPVLARLEISAQTGNGSSRRSGRR